MVGVSTLVKDLNINIFLSSTWMMSDSVKLDHKNHLNDSYEINQGGIECSNHISTRVAGCQTCSRWEILASHHVGQGTRNIYRSECGRTSLGLLRLVEILWWFLAMPSFVYFLVRSFQRWCAVLSFCPFVLTFVAWLPVTLTHTTLLILVMLHKAQLKLKSASVMKSVLNLQQCIY